MADPARTETWPRFRGHDGAGVAAGQNVPHQLDQETLCWSAALPGDGSSSPVIWEQEVFITAEDRKKGEVYLACVDAESGKVKWSKPFKVGEYHLHRFNNTAAVTPCLTENLVVFSWYSTDRKAVMLSALDHGGTVVWENEIGPWKGKHGPAMNPVAADGKIVIAHLHRLGGYAAAYDAGTGKEAWRTPYPEGSDVSYATPLVRETAKGDQEVIIAGTAIGVWALDLATGQKNWALPGFLPMRAIVSPTEIYRDEESGDSIIHVGCKIANYFGVRPPDAQEEGAPGKIAWHFKSKDAPYVPNPVSDGEVVYVLSDGGKLSALEARTGKLRWAEQLPGNFYASPVLVGGKLFCLSREGEMYVAEAGPAYKELAVSDLRPADAIRWTDATPAVAHNRLYVRVGDRLDCYGAK